MGLFKNSILNTFGFWRQHLGKLVLYELFSSIFLIAGAIMILPLFLIFLIQLTPFIQMSPVLINLFTVLSENTILSTTPMSFWIFLAVVGIIILVIFGIAQAGGYPLILKQALKGGKINIINAFIGGLKKTHKIFAIFMIIFLPFLFLAIISILLAKSGSIVGIVSMGLLILVLIIAIFYIFIRVLF